MEDTKIIELYFARDEQAIKETEQKYGRLCHSISYNILQNAEDSEECVNDTFSALWNAIPPTKPDNFMAFVCKIARNISLKRLEFLSREKRAANITLSFEELDCILPDTAASVNIDDEELGRLINKFLLAQKEDTRNVFLRRYFFFDSIEEIAKRYGFTNSKVKNMLLNTRKKLKDFLIKEGFQL